MVCHDIATCHFNLLELWDSVWQSIDTNVRIGEYPISHSYVRWELFHMVGWAWRLAERHCLLREFDVIRCMPMWSKALDTLTVIRTMLKGVTCGGSPHTYVCLLKNLGKNAKRKIKENKKGKKRKIHLKLIHYFNIFFKI